MVIFLKFIYYKIYYILYYILYIIYNIICLRKRLKIAIIMYLYFILTSNFFIFKIIY